MLALAFCWPIVRAPRTTVLFDLGDPLLQTWELAWQRHFLFGGGDFWTGNIFLAARNNFAFTDSLLGYLPFSLIGGDDQAGALLRYNIVFLFASTLAFVGGYWLVRQLGGSWHAAALGAVVFAWAPWRLAHVHHLNLLSTGGIALALYALARGHGFSLRHGFRPELARPGWALAGWLIATWQITIGFATGLPFAYVLGAVGVAIAVAMWRGRSRITRRLVIANGVGVGVFLVITLLMTLPYLRVIDLYKFKRTAEELAVYSPPPQGLITTSHFSWLWSDTALTRWTWEMDPAPWEKWIFPGLVLVMFAVIGLFVSAWPRRTRILLGAGAVLTGILALGTSFFHGTFTYLLLWKFMPGWDALRTPGRLIIWTTLLLILLAAGAVTRLAQVLAENRTVSPVRRRLLALVMVLPALGAALESAPVLPYAHPPEPPAALSEAFAMEPRDGGTLILPIHLTGDSIPMLWSIKEGFPVIANGNTGNYPKSWTELSKISTAFPSPRSIDEMKKYGIRKVVVIRSLLEMPRSAGDKSPTYDKALVRSVKGLPVTRTDLSDVVVFTLH
ncbi:hypothetical protein AOZ06_00440 [Kibdelosporangium phytohabitans]|uniref:Glycosyltransferase RgtA/B/C/D-like domain-containing protein n=1 Tax=Kibdelosporangium phytohabitans TaxID=860235 RepID=A0A0N7F2E4_9PSEU|nr:hypothetical protein AOZ06_00440 [Kibdelosporangium phytohabitans]